MQTPPDPLRLIIFPGDGIGPKITQELGGTVSTSAFTLETIQKIASIP